MKLSHIPLAGLVDFVPRLSQDEQMSFFSDKTKFEGLTLREYWLKDLAWCREYACQTPSKIRKLARENELRARSGLEPLSI